MNLSNTLTGNLYTTLWTFCNSDFSTRIISIQADLTQRCIELLNLKEKEKYFILDIGCGSGISGTELTNEGHFWVGLDISRDMMSNFQPQKT